ncbi:hypothetical protein ANCCEY_11067 [Ancylostoma ceylanicum]|uniref:Endonuclease/exonuclease/phosphatase domain-containing protein n=1 Tax=Ancylostoma ceylanicum TaxID=53326 RepID=A0A0D6LCP6_9BILA|nr:hypothetical protein ANCCEY_11067 [Ancylostoma ceylanicum]
MKRRTIRILCLQETRWKGSKPVEIADDITLFYDGVETKKNGVAIAVDASLKDHISSVTRVSDRIILLRIATAEGFWTVVSVYAPQCGCTKMEKATFYEELDDVIRSVPKNLQFFNNVMSEICEVPDIRQSAFDPNYHSD